MKSNLLLTLGVALATSLVASAQDAPQPERPARPARPGGGGPGGPGGPGAGQLPPELLKEYDKDGDGKLSDDERTAMREAMRAKFEEARKAMIAKYDADGDGKLNEEESAKARADRQAEMIKRFDKDGDGKLSDEERKAMPQRPGFGRPGGRRGGPDAPPPGGPGAPPPPPPGAGAPPPPAPVE